MARKKRTRVEHPYIKLFRGRPGVSMAGVRGGVIRLGLATRHNKKRLPVKLGGDRLGTVATFNRLHPRGPGGRFVRK